MNPGEQTHSDALVAPTPWNTESIHGWQLDPYEKVPVTVLSGFLGAGNTTVLENMLRNSEEIRVGLGSSSSLWDAEQDSNACIQARPLAEFLAEQVEAADRVILAKTNQHSSA